MIIPRPASATTAAIQSSSFSSVSCFVYGTLMTDSVLKTLIGRVPKMIKPAYLPAHVRHPVRNFVFPGVIPIEKTIDKSSYTPKSVSSCSPIPPILELGVPYVEGVILGDLTSNEVKVFDWYEDTAYERSIVSVWIPSTDEASVVLGKPNVNAPPVSWEKYDTNIYLWANPIIELEQDKDWDYEYFVQNKLQWYLENTVIPCQKQLDLLGIRVSDE